jgi:hypothetical protein
MRVATGMCVLTLDCLCMPTTAECYQALADDTQGCRWRGAMSWCLGKLVGDLNLKDLKSGWCSP